MKKINEITIKKLASMYKSKEISVTEVVQEYLRRIEDYDKGEMGLNSVLEINPEIMSIAKKMDSEYSEKKSPLYGIPILIKDNIATADKMHTSAGSLALADSIPTNDAEIIKLLREKGALILGKTNMTEFANHMTKGMPAGYSSRGGQVISPYVKDGDPSGSSTGSAVAVTANLCVAAIGTDTAGSIISPSLRNSIVGFRPSMGELSQKGIIPICFTCDTAGPMTRTVDDAITLFTEMSGIHVSTDEMSGLQGIKVAINERELRDMESEEGKRIDQILLTLEKEGAVIQRMDIDPISHDYIETIQKYEFKYAMNRYLASLPKGYPIRSLKDIVEYNNQHKDVALVYGQTQLLEALDHTRGDLSEEEFIDQLKDREKHKMAIYDMLKDVDCVINFKDCLYSQYTGLPIIAVPCGLMNNGMPYGITMTALTEAGLLKNAHQIDKVIGERVSPALL